MSIQITPAAVQQINALRVAENRPNAFVKVVQAPTQADVTGPNYSVHLVEDHNGEAEWVFNQDGVQVVVDKAGFQENYNGLQVDYTQDRGFFFVSPPVAAACGVAPVAAVGSGCCGGGCGSTPEIVKPSTSTGSCCG
jgi:Fe-S cluster assembly iron-binding protein IscA